MKGMAKTRSRCFNLKPGTRVDVFQNQECIIRNNSNWNISRYELHDSEPV